MQTLINSAIKRVTRTFAATFADAEILQHSRRAGAARVSVNEIGPVEDPKD